MTWMIFIFWTHIFLKERICLQKKRFKFLEIKLSGMGENERFTGQYKVNCTKLRAPWLHGKTYT